jgi:hypothetical protein
MRTSSAVFVASLALVGTGCAATRFNSTWANPEAKAVSLQGKKVVALVISKEEATRRGSEDELAYDITLRGGQGVAAYKILPTGDVRDKDMAKAAFEKAGAAAVVTMRVLDSHQELNSTGGSMWYAGPAYGSFWGSYWSTGWTAVYSPGYISTETIVSVETLVYSLEQDKLLWAGRSQTTNPSRVDTLIKELANNAANEMKKAGLLKPAAK